jgi:hypothetical protein
MNNIQRGEALLAKLGPSLGLTPCGRDWLVAALDPFHDNQLDHLTGYPDAVTSCSVIRQVKLSLEIATAGSEDVYIVCWPWLGNTELGAYSQTASTVTLPGTIVGQVPGVSVYKPATGNPPDFANLPAQGLTYPSVMQNGKGRLVGMGLELINTTAPINRSGTIYCWRLPGIQDNEETLQYLTAAVLTRVGHVRRLATPPRSPAQAMLIPGTRSWASEEGAYSVCPFEEDNPPMYPTTNYPIVNTIPSLPMSVGGTNGPTNVITGNCAATSLSCRLTPCNLFGTIATGNNPNSKFTLNVVWYYEEFPDEQSDILTLATPSCEVDPVALKLYTHILNTLPIAVPSSWNAAGDWWWDVVSAVKDYASQVGGMIGGAPGAAIGAAAGTVAGWARDRYMTAPGSNGSGVPQKQKTKPNVQQQRANQKKAQPAKQQQAKKPPPGGRYSNQKGGRQGKKTDAQKAIDALWSAR